MAKKNTLWLPLSARCSFPALLSLCVSYLTCVLYILHWIISCISGYWSTLPRLQIALSLVDKMIIVLTHHRKTLPYFTFFNFVTNIKAIFTRSFDFLRVLIYWYIIGTIMDADYCPLNRHFSVGTETIAETWYRHDIDQRMGITDTILWLLRHMKLNRILYVRVHSAYH